MRAGCLLFPAVGRSSPGSRANAPARQAGMEKAMTVLTSRRAAFCRRVAISAVVVAWSGAALAAGVSVSVGGVGASVGVSGSGVSASVGTGGTTANCERRRNQRQWNLRHCEPRRRRNDRRRRRQPRRGRRGREPLGQRRRRRGGDRRRRVRRRNNRRAAQQRDDDGRGRRGRRRQRRRRSPRRPANVPEHPRGPGALRQRPGDPVSPRRAAVNRPTRPPTGG